MFQVVRQQRACRGPSWRSLAARLPGAASDEFFATLYSRYQVDVAAQEARQDLTAAQRFARAHALAQELQRGEPSRLP